jgi:multidrug transporter EmrE-like cation transporter
MNQFLSLICLSILEIFADFSIEKYVNTGVLTQLWAGIGGYGGIIFFLIKALKGSSILVVNGLWDGISGIVESIAAMVFLGQRLENGWQYLGLAMICTGVMFMKIKTKKEQ